LSSRPNETKHSEEGFAPHRVRSATDGVLEKDVHDGTAKQPTLKAATMINVNPIAAVFGFKDFNRLGCNIIFPTSAS